MVIISHHKILQVLIGVAQDGIVLKVVQELACQLVEHQQGDVTLRQQHVWLHLIQDLRVKQKMFGFVSAGLPHVGVVQEEKWPIADLSTYIIYLVFEIVTLDIVEFKKELKHTGGSMIFLSFISNQLDTNNQK